MLGATDLRHRGDHRGGATIADSLAQVLGTMGGLQARMGGMEAGGQGPAGRAPGDLGAALSCSPYRGAGAVDFVEDGSNESLKSLVRKCPGCASLLTFNEGQSSYELQCDGPHHEGPTSIRFASRFSCLDCGKFDFCIPCAQSIRHLLLLKRCTQQSPSALPAAFCALTVPYLTSACLTSACRVTVHRLCIKHNASCAAAVLRRYA